MFRFAPPAKTAVPLALIVLCGGLWAGSTARAQSALSSETALGTQAQRGGAQNPAPNPASKPPEQAAASVQNSAEKPGEPEKRQTNRILWIVPNFAAVSPDVEVPRLTTAAKFRLATSDSLDYSGFTWTGVLAAQSELLNSDPELGQGAAGYGRYYWRAFADSVSGTYFTEAIIPALTREDPRYFTLGHGGFFHRTWYALSRTVITKTDSGGSSFNWSEVAGNLLEAGLSNAYYPPQEVGATQTFRDWGTQMESAALNNVVKEFWPDIRRGVFRQK